MSLAARSARQQSEYLKCHKLLSFAQIVVTECEGLSERQRERERKKNTGGGAAAPEHEATRMPLNSFTDT